MKLTIWLKHEQALPKKMRNCKKDIMKNHLKPKASLHKCRGNSYQTSKVTSCNLITFLNGELIYIYIFYAHY